MKTLENFLRKHQSNDEFFRFAKDLTLEQFLERCERGDWILWLFARTNPKSKQEVILAAGHCANTVRYLMEDERSLKAIDAAIAFGEGRATKEELKVAASASAFASVSVSASDSASVSAAYAATAATAAAYAVVYAPSAAYAAAYAAAHAVVYAPSAAYADATAAAYVAKKQNQKLTADICRKYLPLEIWNQNEI